MLVGWHHLDDSCPDVLPCAAFLDVAGSGVGMKSPERLCRIYFKGRPDPREIARKATAWAVQGCRVQIGNEPNLPMEGFVGGPDDFAAWFAQVAGFAPTARLYWPGVSPGVPGWEEWYRGTCAEVIREAASGLAVHAYGSAREFLTQFGAAVTASLGKPIWVAECNPGAGRSFDRDAWARDELPKILEYCRAAGCEAFTYFAYRWPTPDMALPSPVDGVGTEIERVIREWKPKEAPLPILNGVDVSNWQGHIDWPQVAQSGRAFAFIKATEDSDFVDPWFPANWQRCKEVGMARGAYCFARPSKSSPADSVTLFEATIKSAGGLAEGDLIALDIEDEKFAGSLHVWVAEWLDLAERTFGVRPVIYTGHWYSEPHDLEHPDLSKYPLWYASYQDQLPPPPTGWQKVTFWQHSAHAQVPGVAGDCDVDRFYGSPDELRALGKQAEPVEPLPPPKPNRVAAALAKLRAATDELEQAIKEAA